MTCKHCQIIYYWHAWARYVTIYEDIRACMTFSLVALLVTLHIMCTFLCKESTRYVSNAVKSIEEHHGNDIVKVLVGNKLDMATKREVHYRYAQVSFL